MEQFFVVLLHTGLRAGEALGLPWSAVDLDAATLTVRQGMVEVDGVPTITGVKTKNSRRTISCRRKRWRPSVNSGGSSLKRSSPRGRSGATPTTLSSRTGSAGS